MGRPLSCDELWLLWLLGAEPDNVRAGHEAGSQLPPCPLGEEAAAVWPKNKSPPQDRKSIEPPAAAVFLCRIS